MSKTGAVWGIDLGQCALKAMRCRPSATDGKIEAVAFDYIEYPKILSQPDADPPELIHDALKQFLSRNTVRGDSVAISVSGQAGLARFIKLPPVEAKKIPDLVRYEAKQQIPFDLNDVIWDYQRLGIGLEEEGFALENEVGLFAMKRDAVERALKPYGREDIDVDLIQLTPLSLYNFLVFDQLNDLPPSDEYDPDNPPESVVILSLGTDSTDLVVTNGYRVWQRSIPVGGNHFTKALTKEMKLTFAKAEHLKKNATSSADPKAVFQAMRPVFNDLLTELQRSISYFSNVDRTAKIGRIAALGNTMKLPGLRRYLAQNLGFDIERVESFRQLEGPQVVSSPIFQENAISFGVCYGLAIQALNKGGIRTNLLPREILRKRMIKAKKPWAVAAAASVLLACGISCGANALNLINVDKASWSDAEKAADDVAKKSSALTSEASSAKGEFTATEQIGKNLVKNVESRIRWLELLKAINSALPQNDPPKEEDEKLSSADRVMSRKELRIKNLDCQYVEDPSAWWTLVQQKQSGSTEPVTTTNGDASSMPSGAGWVVKIEGVHYHNSDVLSKDNIAAKYVEDTLVNGLKNNKIKLPNVDHTELVETSMAELGISFPVLLTPESKPKSGVEIDDPYSEVATKANAAGDANKIKVKEYQFDVEFFWQPKLPGEREEIRKKKAAEEKQNEAKQTEANASGA